MGSSKLIFPFLTVAIAILAYLYNNDSSLYSIMGGLSGLIGLSEPSEPTFTSDEHTTIDGIPFPRSISSAGFAQSFIGGGTRVKWMVKVYGVGLYCESKLVKSLSKTYKGISADSLLGGGSNDGSNNESDGSSSTSNLFKEFAASKPAKTLLLRFHREVAASDVSEALGEALVPRIGAQSSQTFQKFILDMVGENKLEKGADIFITCKGEKLWASLTGGKKGGDVIGLKGLCEAVFMVYLGEEPVSRQAKEGFAQGIVELMA